MTPGRRALILMPAHNEAACIGPVVEAVRALDMGAKVVVIDDASTDGTAKAASEAGAVVLRLPVQLGAWGAMRTGFRYARKCGVDIAVTMDADGQHDAADLARLMAPVEQGAADVAIGSCTERGSAARKAVWAIFRIMTGLDVADLTSGFRAYSKWAVDIVMQSDTALLDYQDVGVLLALRKAGGRIVEVPVTMGCRINGASRIYSNWLKVFRYLIITTVLCISRIDVPAIRSAGAGGLQRKEQQPGPPGSGMDGSGDGGRPF